VSKKSALIVLAVVAVVVLLVNGCVIPWPGSAKSLYLDAASDGSGGAFAVWEDENVAYGQRIDFEGKLRWGDGVRLSTLHCWYPPRVTGDGSGGVVVVAEAGRRFAYSERIYAQRIDSQGNPLWTEGGVRVDPVSKISVLSPWVAVAAAVVVGAGVFVLRRRRA